MKRRVLMVAGLCAAASGGSVSAQCWQQRLIAGDTINADEGFGAAMFMSGDGLLIGAKKARGATANTGGAYVFRRLGSAFTFETKLVPPGAGAPQFGTAVAMDGDVAIIGAPLDAQAAISGGAAYVFRRVNGSWAQEAKLLAPDPLPGDRIGLSVAIKGDLAVVGAPFKSDVGLQAGCAYVYQRTNGVWGAGQRIDFDGNDAAFFGSAVACAPGVVVVGAINKYTGGAGGQGAAYSFRPVGQGWARDPIITPSDAAEGDSFGIFVSLSGDALLVGAYLADGPGGADQGAAYVFRANRAGLFVQEKKLQADDGAADDQFGSAGGMSGNDVVIGSYRATLQNGSHQGAAYAFRKSADWAQVQKLIASDPATDDGAGLSAATDGGCFAIGAPNKDLALSNAGAAYTFGPCVCYPNCDGSTAPPVLNALDFGCFINRFAGGESYANCDGSTAPPMINALDFGCFLNKFAAGCT